MPSPKDIMLTLRILQRISQHTQKSKIKIPALSEEFGIDERNVKYRVSLLRRAGFKVASNKNTKDGEEQGVWLASSAEEIYPTAMRLRQEGLELFVQAKNLLDFKSADPTIFEQLPDLPEELRQLVEDPDGYLKQQETEHIS